MKSIEAVQSELDAMLRLMGIRPEAVAAGLARACERMNREHPEACDHFLGQMWLQISALLQPQLPAQFASGRIMLCAAILLLEQYFLRSGNWKAMEARLAGAGPIDPWERSA